MPPPSPSPSPSPSPDSAPAAPLPVQLLTPPVSPKQTNTDYKLLHDKKDAHMTPARRPTTWSAEPVTLPSAAAIVALTSSTSSTSPSPISKLHEWKSSLCITGAPLRCGAKTKKTGAPCRNSKRRAAAAAAAQHGEVNVAIATLMSPSLSPYELEAQLRLLAQLVHCHRHDHPPAIEARIDMWLATLPSDDDRKGDSSWGSTPAASRQPTMPRRLRSIIGPYPAHCTGVTGAGNPCAIKMSHRKKHDYERTVDAMVQTTMTGADSFSHHRQHRMSDLVRVLHYSILCHKHQEPPYRYRHQKQWSISINKFAAACQCESSRVEEEKEETKEKQQQWQQKMKSPPSPPRTGDAADAGHGPAVASQEPSGEEETEPPFDAAGYWTAEDKIYETSAFLILGVGDFDDDGGGGGDDDGENIPSQEISRVIQEPLDQSRNKAENEVHDGFVYVYSVPGNDGLIKIGFTTRDVGVRHQEWAADCRREPTLLYPRPASASAVTPTQEPMEGDRIPHARRVEKLVHAELMRYRDRVYCPPCKIQHIEWFRVSLDQAIAAIQRWTRWIRTRPYQQQQKVRMAGRAAAKVTWRLAERELDKNNQWAGFHEYFGCTSSQNKKSFSSHLEDSV